MSRFIRPSLNLALAALMLCISAPAFAAVDGAALYRSKCAACHGADGTGNTPVGRTLHVKSLAGSDVQKMKDEDLRKVITDGKGKMPAFSGKLSAEEISALIGVIRGFAPHN